MGWGTWWLLCMCLKNISPNNFVVMMHLAEVDVWKFVALSFFWCALQGRGWKTPSKLWGGILNIHFDSKIHFERKIGSTQCRVHVGSKHGVKVKVEVILGIVEAWGCHFKSLMSLWETHLWEPLWETHLLEPLWEIHLWEPLGETHFWEPLRETHLWEPLWGTHLW